VFEKAKILSGTPEKLVYREITNMQKIQRHEHIVKLYEVLETEDELYLILEHMEGGNLFDYIIKKGWLPE
jgi:serine/threonine protein kinase